ncbi:MAG: Phosphatidylglycerol:prolipoprotein diacylglycerol transferase [Bacteroidota bacterium]
MVEGKKDLLKQNYNTSLAIFELRPMINLAIPWSPEPELFPGLLPVRWYGLLFMSGFVFGYYILQKIFVRHGKDPRLLDDLALYVGFGTILGARLGHCLFYEPAYYLSHPLEIIKIWLLDRVVVVVALAGALIRLGNLFNSEIVGEPTDLPWGFVFERLGENFPRHPSQLYESLFYFLCFLVLRWMERKHPSAQQPGALLGAFLVLVFGFRFFIEFLKADQVNFESQMMLNMGQWLSIPAIVLGLLLWSGRLPWKSKAA